MKKSELLQELAKIHGYAMACDEIDPGLLQSYCESLTSMINDLSDNATYPILDDLKDMTRG